jgi:hypothetical protein
MYNSYFLLCLARNFQPVIILSCCKITTHILLFSIQRLQWPIFDQFHKVLTLRYLKNNNKNIEIFNVDKLENECHHTTATTGRRSPPDVILLPQVRSMYTY